MDVINGAGHDAKYVANVCPASMIFIPCKDGISHNEIKDATPEHTTAGCDVLLHAFLEADGWDDSELSEQLRPGEPYSGFRMTVWDAHDGRTSPDLSMTQ